MNTCDIATFFNIININHIESNQNYYKGDICDILFYSDEQFTESNYLEKPIVTQRVEIKKDIKFDKKIRYNNEIFGSNFEKDKPENFFRKLLFKDKDDISIKNVIDNLYRTLLNKFDTQNLYTQYSYFSNKINKINKSYLRNSLLQRTLNNDVIQLIADERGYNIIILFDSKINYYCKGFEFSIYRPTFIFEQLPNNLYQRIYDKNKKSPYFVSDDDIVLRLLKKKTLMKVKNKEEVEQADSKEEEPQSNKIKIDEVDKDTILFTNYDNKEEQGKKSLYNVTKIHKMKLSELQKIAENMELNLMKPTKNGKGMKKKLKIDLISEIINIKKI